jgi:hypothetical protein
MITRARRAPAREKAPNQGCHSPARRRTVALMTANQSRSSRSSWRRITCRFNLWHRWRTHQVDDGGHYQTCLDCEKYRDVPIPGAPMGM